MKRDILEIDTVVCSNRKVEKTVFVYSDQPMWPIMQLYELDALYSLGDYWDLFNEEIL